MEVAKGKHKMFLTDARISEDGELLIYGQYSKDEDLINDLMSKIKAQSQFLKPIQSLEIGDMCLALFAEDSQWYRGILRGVSRNFFSVEFIDYGNIQATSVADMRCIPGEFASLEPQARQFLLDVGGSPLNPSGTWTVEVTEALMNEYLYAEVEIEIFRNEMGVTVAKSDAITKVLTDQGLVGVNRACSKSVFSVSKLPREGYVTGQNINVILTDVESDGSFFCFNAANKLSLNRQLTSLQYACTESDARPLRDPRKGMLCCAMSSVDGNWHRSEILEVEGEHAYVRFIDYGSTDSCSLKSLLALGKEFANLPAQSIHCSLQADLEREELIETLSKLKKRELMVEFMCADIFPYKVRMYFNNSVVGIHTRGNTGEICSENVQQLTASGKNMAFHKRPTLSSGSSKNILLTETGDISSLWCMLAEDQQKMSWLSHEMLKMFRGSARGTWDLEQKQFAINQPCAIFDPDDELWYRSKVLSCAGPDILTVLCVDLGRIKTVHSKQVRAVGGPLLDMPALAIRFAPTSILSSSGDPMPLEKCRLLMQGVKGMTFTAVFNIYNRDEDLYFVELHDVMRNIRISDSNVKGRIPCADVLLNSELPIRITYVENPDRLWVQLLDYHGNLIMLTQKMDDYYNALPPQTSLLTDIYQGKSCCIRSSKTRHWCRGEIVYFYDDIVEVKLIDFGHEEALSVRDARVLMTDFMSVPKQAVCCCLYNLRPTTRSWCNGCIRYLNEFVAKTGVTAKFLGCKENIYSADVFVESQDGKILLAEKAVDQKFALWVGPNALQSSAAFSNGAMDTILTIAKQPALPKLYYRGLGTTLIGAEVPAVLCEFPTPADFYILPQNSTHKQLIERLNHDLMVYLDAKPANFVEIYVGMPCVCVIKEDCFRAAVVSEKNTSNLLVLLVDLGVRKNVPMSSLRKIAQEHIFLVSPMAIRCTLHGVIEPKRQFWCSNAALMFSEFRKVAMRNLVCTVHGCVTNGVFDFYMVSLQTPFQDIAQSMVETANCSIVNPIGRVYLPFRLKSFIYCHVDTGIGKESNFYVTHIERVDLFYCQLARKFDAIDDLMDKVQAYCCEYKQNETVTGQELSNSPPCFAKHHNGKWFRAHFVPITGRATDHVTVIFVDYGNIVTVPLHNVIPCVYESGLMELPIQAVPCSLSEIVTTISDTTRHDEILSRMKNELLGHQLAGTVIGSTSGKLHLDFFKDQKRVNDKIIGKTSLSVAISSSPKSDDDSLSEGKFKEIENIAPMSIHSVYISAIIDPSFFQIRLQAYDNDFNTCVSEVDGQYTAMRRNDYTVSVLRDGDVVCAKHPKTFHWCRGMVIDVESHKPNHVVVEFVDFGDRECISIEDSVKKLQKEMLHWPKMTVNCQLANACPLADEWTQENVDYFVNMCQSVHCRVRFRTYDVTRRIWTVDLKIAGKSVSHMMVEDRHSKFSNAPSSTISSNTELVNTKPVDFWVQGMRKEVYIAHVESACEVFLQLVEFEASLNALMAKLNQPSLVFTPLSKPRPQQSCIAKYADDGKYYRANIVSFESDRCCVLYSDYGNLGHVMPDELRTLQKNFASLPEQAVKCTVAFPQGVDDDSIVKKLEDFAVDDTIAVFAKCLKVATESSPMEVELTIKEQDRTSTTSFSDIFVSKDTLNESAGNVVPELKYQMMDLNTDVEAKVYVAQVDGPENIWIQLSSESAELDGIMLKIGQFCSDGAATKKMDTLAVGSPCLAKYCDDGCWYRGEIAELLPSGNVLVHFVDYGNKDETKVVDILAMDKRFLTLPKQATSCKLVNVAGFYKWTSSDTDDFVERVSDIELTARFHTCEEAPGIYEVELIYPCGKSLNEEWNETLKNRSQQDLPEAGAGDRVSSRNSLQNIVGEQHIVTDRGDHVIVENLRFSTGIDFDTLEDCHLSSQWALSQIHAGCTLCMTVVEVKDRNCITGISLCVPDHALRSKVEKFLAVLGDNLAGHCVAVKDAKPESVYLLQTSSVVNCIKVLSIDNGSAKAIDISSKGLIEIENGGALLAPSADIELLAKSLVVSCVVVELRGFTDLPDMVGRAIAADFLRQVEDGNWAIKASCIVDKDVTQMLEAEKCGPNAIPDVLVTDPDEVDQETRLKSWISENMHSFARFLVKGADLFEGCPESFVFICKALKESRELVMFHLSEQEKAVFQSFEECDSTNDTQKQMSAESGGMESLTNEASLDIPEVFKSMWGPDESEWFCVGDEFEAVISNVCDPGRFFVRPFLVMSEPRTAAESKAYDIGKRLEKLHKNCHCIAKCVDWPAKIHHWVRAVVQGFEGTDFLVKDLDTGLEFVAKGEHIFPVGEDVKLWPSFCMECALAGIKPKPIAGGEQKWSDHAICELKNILSNAHVSDCVELQIVSITTDPETSKERYSMNLMLNGKSVTEMLVSLQVADPVDLEMDKENMVEIPDTTTSELDQRLTRKPLAELTSEMKVKQPYEVITPKTPDSVGLFFPNFDLLAVPWKVIRVSVEGSRDESLSDSVFCSDLEESSATAQALMFFAGKKMLTSFKIYCSVKSLGCSKGELALASDSVEKSLGNEFPNVAACRARSIISPSLLEDARDQKARQIEESAEEAMNNVCPNKCETKNVETIDELAAKRALHSMDAEKIDKKSTAVCPDLGTLNDVQLRQNDGVVKDVYDEAAIILVEDTLRAVVADEQYEESENLEIVDSLDETRISGEKECGKIPEEDGVSDVESGTNGDVARTVLPDSLDAVQDSEKLELLDGDEASSEDPGMGDLGHRLPTIDEICESVPIQEQSTAHQEGNFKLSDHRQAVAIRDQNVVHQRNEIHHAVKSLKDAETVNEAPWEDGIESSDHRQDLISYAIGNLDMHHFENQTQRTEEHENVTKKIANVEVILVEEEVDQDECTHRTISEDDEPLKLFNCLESVQCDDSPVEKEREANSAKEGYFHENDTLCESLQTDFQKMFQECESNGGLFSGHRNLVSGCSSDELDDVNCGDRSSGGESLLAIPLLPMDAWNAPLSTEVAEVPKDCAEKGVDQSKLTKATPSQKQHHLQPVLDIELHKLSNDGEEEEVGSLQLCDDVGAGGREELVLTQDGLAVKEVLFLSDAEERLELVERATIVSQLPDSNTQLKPNVDTSEDVCEEISDKLDSNILSAVIADEQNEESESCASLLVEKETGKILCEDDLTAIEIGTNEDKMKGVVPDSLSTLQHSEQMELSDVENETEAVMEVREEVLPSQEGDEEQDTALDQLTGTKIDNVTTDVLLHTEGMEDGLSLKYDGSGEGLLKIVSGASSEKGCGKVAENILGSCAVSHQHQQLYICCLPKMHLEVGDTCRATFMIMVDPHTLHLQFDSGIDFDDWQNAMSGAEVLGDHIHDENWIWKTDMLCVVKFDSAWERGRIVRVDAELCEVELFDYGQIVKTTVSSLREIPENLCLYPRQTAQCKLYGISMLEENTGTPNSITAVYLNDLLMCSSLLAEIVEISETATDQVYSVRLYLMEEDEQGQDVAALLIDKGLATIEMKEDEMGDDKEWSTVTESAWENALCLDVGRSPTMRSSNIDLSFGNLPFEGEELTKIEKSDVSTEWEKFPPDDDQIQALAREILSEVFTNAVAIVESERNDPADDNSLVVEKGESETEGVEEIPRIFDEGFVPDFQSVVTAELETLDSN